MPVKFLSYDDIRNQADGFLARHHPSGELPILIEEIIDLQLKINIIPIPGLQQAYGVEAFITSDMTAIYVDSYICDAVPSRYRFSLAHEIAHAVLHQKVFRQLGDYDDIDGWQRVQQSISEKDHNWLEWQAYTFAGLVLVPRDPLRQQFDDAANTAREKGVDPGRISDAGRRMIAANIARTFAVSIHVVEKRVEKDGLWKS